MEVPELTKLSAATTLVTSDCPGPRALGTLHHPVTITTRALDVPARAAHLALHHSTAHPQYRTTASATRADPSQCPLTFRAGVRARAFAIGTRMSLGPTTRR